MGRHALGERGAGREATGWLTGGAGLQRLGGEKRWVTGGPCVLAGSVRSEGEREGVGRVASWATREEGEGGAGRAVGLGWA